MWVCVEVAEKEDQYGAVIYGRLDEHSLVVDWMDANGMRAPARAFLACPLTSRSPAHCMPAVVNLCRVHAYMSLWFGCVLPKSTAPSLVHAFISFFLSSLFVPRFLFFPLVSYRLFIFLSRTLLSPVETLARGRRKSSKEMEINGSISVRISFCLSCI